MESGEPDNIAEIGQEVWQPEGITVLGTPIGSNHYTATKMDERIAEEIVGRNSFSRQSAVRLADPLAERQPSRKSFDANIAAHFVRTIL